MDIDDYEYRRKNVEVYIDWGDDGQTPTYTEYDYLRECFIVKRPATKDDLAAYVE